MSARHESEVRALLDGPHPPVPPDLAALAAGRGHHLLRRRRALRRTAWFLLAVAVTAFTVWAALTEPWVLPPSTYAPPFEGP
ncbi:hypothetical protein [Streptomyces sp. NPDC097619]|uniref:hypothetical protein n=1 Tax=Streptomyces sp. NPDC097619 TaxID=3157228 RepID=UPI00331E4FEE